MPLLLWAHAGSGQTDGRTPYIYIDLAPHTMRAVPIIATLFDVLYMPLRQKGLTLPSGSEINRAGSRYSYIILRTAAAAAAAAGVGGADAAADRSASGCSRACRRL